MSGKFPFVERFRQVQSNWPIDCAPMLRCISRQLAQGGNSADRRLRVRTYPFRTRREVTRRSFSAPELGSKTLYANLGRAAGETDPNVYALIWNPRE
jgi:hypothetical protein